MKGVLLVAATFAAIGIAAPAAASAGFSASSGTRNIRFTTPPIEIGPGRYLPGQNRGHRRHIHVDDELLAAGGGGWGYGSGGGYYDAGDYDANRSFSPDKWNDWWHERPQRAFPRWVWRNQNCTEDRMWWSGSGWRCTP